MCTPYPIHNSFGDRLPYGLTTAYRVAYSITIPGSFTSDAPTTPASIFRRALLDELSDSGLTIRARGVNRALSGLGRGPWCETFSAGAVSGPLREYDINRAFLASALSWPLPLEMARSSKVDRSTLIVIARYRKEHFFVPRRFDGKRGRILAVTPAESDFFDLDVDIIEAINARFVANVLPNVLDRIDKLGLPSQCWKRLQSSFWGVFAASRGFRQEHYRDGQLTHCRWLKPDPRVTHAAYAQRIVENVVGQMAPHACGRAALVHVDNLVTRDRLDTSTSIGGWRLVRELPRGIYIESSGLWHDDPEGARRLDRSYWLKHSGHRRADEGDPKTVSTEATSRAARALDYATIPDYFSITFDA